MTRKTRIAIRLGSLISSVALCAGIEYFYPSGMLGEQPAPQAVVTSEAPAPAVRAQAPEPPAPSKEPKQAVTANPEPSHDAAAIPSRIAPPVAEEASRFPVEPRMPAAVPKQAIAESRPIEEPEEARETVATSAEESERVPAEAAPAAVEPAPVAPPPSPLIVAAQPAPAPEPVKVADLSPQEVSQPAAIAPVGEAPAPQAQPIVKEAAKPAEPAKKPEAPKAAPAPAVAEAEEEEPELWIKPSVGYGVRYFQFEQSGAFGGIKGGSLAMNALTFDTMVRYGAWSLSAGLEKFSAKLVGDTTDPTIRSGQEFKRFYLKPGYGIFFLGVDAKTAPIVRASGTTLSWTGLTTLSALAGIRKEWLFDNRRRRKPFLLGFEVEGSYPLSASGDGGAPSVSSPSGYGASLRGYAEKSIVRREEYRLSFGLDGTASYDKLNFSGTWGGSSGGSTRSILEVGSKIYLGIEF